jgi:molecular chaperone IbpA
MNYTFDTAHLYGKILPNTIGFDSIFKTLDQLTSNTTIRTPGYPPYNIKRVQENKYMIEVAVAGFSPEQIDIELQEQVLTIKGINTVDSLTTDGVDITYLHKGIAERDFVRTFNLAEHVEVTNAELVNGMLKISLERVLPEEKKPRKIAISSFTKDSKLLTE